MKTIRVIDLLNKIANGEEVPKKVRYEYKDYVYKVNCEDYYCEEESRYLFEVIVHDENWKLSYAMNIGVEIIEEPRNIEKLKLSGNDFIDTSRIENKINEIIEVINERNI